MIGTWVNCTLTSLHFLPLASNSSLMIKFWLELLHLLVFALFSLGKWLFFYIVSKGLVRSQLANENLSGRYTDYY